MLLVKIILLHMQCAEFCFQTSNMHMKWFYGLAGSHTCWVVSLTYRISLQLNGDIPEQKGGRFAPPLSIPQLKEALEKAAYDPRIRGIHLKIGSVSAGWAKLQVSLFWHMCLHMNSVYLAAKTITIYRFPAMLGTY